MLERRVIDMTLDEAIAKYKEITNTDAVCPAHCNIPCDKCVQESEQLVEWLEELKVYQQHEIICNKGYNEGYNKAIDDFVKLVHKHDWNIRNINENSFIYGAIDTLAEQLKAGD